LIQGRSGNDLPLGARQRAFGNGQQATARRRAAEELRRYDRVVKVDHGRALRRAQLDVESDQIIIASRRAGRSNSVVTVGLFWGHTGLFHHSG